MCTHTLHVAFEIACSNPFSTSRGLQTSKKFFMFILFVAVKEEEEEEEEEDFPPVI